MSRARGLLVAATVFVASAVAVGELVHARAAKQLLGPPQGTSEVPRDVIVVLGCPNSRDGSANWLQRWRCEIAMRSIDPLVETTVVFTGGVTTDGHTSEAAVMAGYAITELGLDPAIVRLEEQARSTWQNLELSTPWLEQAQRIVIVSNSLHAKRAREYLRRQRPDLAQRLRPAEDYLFGERWYAKPPLALYEWLVAGPFAHLATPPPGHP